MSSAVLKVEICVCACVLRARSVVPVNFGRTMAASVPRMTSTSSNSTSVKARCTGRPARSRPGVLVFVFMFVRIRGSFDVLLQRENRQNHSNKDDSNENGDEAKHERLSHCHGCFQVAVQVTFGHVGNAHQFL